jgi:hypothetical protein
MDATCVAKEQNKQNIIKLSQIDLNNDGNPEYLVEAEACGCGARTCPVWIYSKKGKALNLIAAAEVHLQIAPGSTNGYRNLMNIYPSNEGIYHTPMTYTGTEYVFDHSQQEIEPLR